MVTDVVVLGAGTAGLTMALTLKLRVPALKVRVICSREIGVIGVGEGTTVSFPQHFFEYLHLPPGRFFQLAEPTWKLGVPFSVGEPSRILLSVRPGILDALAGSFAPQRVLRRGG